MPHQADHDRKSYQLLSGNALKLIAAVTMLIDHMGLILFPLNILFRVIGRLAFPIYAFMIAEGCKYTHNRLRYFLNLFLLAAACQIVYYLADGSTYLCILVTFSLSILMIYALQNFKAKRTLPAGLLFVTAVSGVYVLNQILAIDYGFWGCMVPVFASLPSGTQYDREPLSVALLGIGLLILSLSSGSLQFFCLAALPLLCCYSGKRGKWKMKSFFYIFYPAHLVLLQAIAWILILLNL